MFDSPGLCLRFDSRIVGLVIARRLTPVFPFCRVCAIVTFASRLAGAALAVIAGTAIARIAASAEAAPLLASFRGAVIVTTVKFAPLRAILRRGIIGPRT